MGSGSLAFTCRHFLSLLVTSCTSKKVFGDVRNPLYGPNAHVLGLAWPNQFSRLSKGESFSLARFQHLLNPPPRDGHRSSQWLTVQALIKPSASPFPFPPNPPAGNEWINHPYQGFCPTHTDALGIGQLYTGPPPVHGYLRVRLDWGQLCTGPATRPGQRIRCGRASLATAAL